MSRKNPKVGEYFFVPGRGEQLQTIDHLKTFDTSDKEDMHDFEEEKRMLEKNYGITPRRI